MFKRTALASLLFATGAFAAPLHGSTPFDPTLAALRSAEELGLATLRAGSVTASTLDEDERAALQRADQASHDLAALRAGEFTDRELGIIAVTAIVIILLIIIL